MTSYFIFEDEHVRASDFYMLFAYAIGCATTSYAFGVPGLAVFVSAASVASCLVNQSVAKLDEDEDD